MSRTAKYHVMDFVSAKDKPGANTRCGYNATRFRRVTPFKFRQILSSETWKILITFVEIDDLRGKLLFSIMNVKLIFFGQLILKVHLRILSIIIRCLNQAIIAFY